jgi:acetate kinase/phosphoesterase RecJ-like protein
MYRFEGLLEEIERAEIITIFRHVRPDCDAAGSQFALKNWIEDNWPQKKVYALGDGYCPQGNCWPVSDTCRNDDIRKSIAIILDTANEKRIDDERYELARKIIKIDHHPNREPYGHLIYVTETAAATCEILAEFFRQCDIAMSQKTAEYLFRGMLTDTLCFRTSNTRAHTLEIAGWIAQFSVRIPELNRELFDQPLKDYRFANMLRNTVRIVDGRMAYRIVTLDEQRQWEYTASQVRNFIDEYGHVREFEIFALITEADANGTIVYDASLRSKVVIINRIAEKYGGGGHNNACGVKDLSRSQLDDLLSDLFASISE